MLEKINGADAVSRMRSMPVFTSGSEGIDLLLGGGYRAGRLFEVFGPSAAGKTQLGMQAAMLAAAGGAGVAFVDSEGSFRPERVEEMATARGKGPERALRNISYVRVDSAAEQVEAVRALRKLREGDAVRLVVVDTLTRNFSLDFPGTSNAPERQGALGAHVAEMARDAFLNRRAYLLTNRVTYSDQTGETHVGGGTVSQLVHAALSLAREGAATKATLVGAGRSKLCRFGPWGVE